MHLKEIKETYEKIQKYLDRQGTVQCENPPFGDGKYDFYSKKVQVIFNEAILHLKVSEIYTQRIQQYLRGEFLEDEFEKKLNKDLKSFSIKRETKEKDPWEWVKTEYVALFKKKNPQRGGHVRESTQRMKAMFAAFPEIRKEDVIETTKLYLSKTNASYIRYPHYFLKKGVGNNAIYEFANWYDKYKELKTTYKEVRGDSKDITNTMQ